MVTGIGINDSNATIAELVHIIPVNRIINRLTCCLRLPLSLKITLLFIKKLIPPETILAKTVAIKTFKASEVGKM